MNMLIFDENGHLTPHSIIETTWDDFRTVFSETLEDKAHRQALLAKYEAYLYEIQMAFSVPFYQWINGSFVTKKQYPGDIDMVTFLPYDIIVGKAIFVERMRRTSKNLYNIDGFFAPTARWNHRFFESSQQEAARWAELFGHSREGLPKGIIKLNFQP